MIESNNYSSFEFFYNILIYLMIIKEINGYSESDFVRFTTILCIGQANTQNRRTLAV